MGVFFDGNRGWRTVDIGRRGRGHQTAGLERSPHWEHHVRPSAIEACYTRTCVPAAAKEDDTKSPSPSPQREPSLPPRCRHDLGRRSPMRAIAPATSRAFARLRTLTEYVRPSCRLLLCFSRIPAPFSVGWHGLYQATIREAQLRSLRRVPTAVLNFRVFSGEFKSESVKVSAMSI